MAQDQKDNEYFKPRTVRKTSVKNIVKADSAPIQEGAKYEVRNGRLVLIEAAPPKPDTAPLALQAGGEYRTYDGRKAQVNVINQTSKAFPVVGLIETNEGWEPRVWNMNGVAKRPYGSNNDLVANWGES